MIVILPRGTVRIANHRRADRDVLGDRLAAAPAKRGTV
jgi:hypothetical protein